MDKVTVAVEMPRSVYSALGVREAELGQMMREALAVELYRLGRLSLGKAAEIAGATMWSMTQILVRHDVYASYDVQDAADDWKTLTELLPG
jgi:predicted HTH domain antitoxin